MPNPTPIQEAIMILWCLISRINPPTQPYVTTILHLLRNDGKGLTPNDVEDAFLAGQRKGWLTMYDLRFPTFTDTFTRGLTAKVHANSLWTATVWGIEGLALLGNLPTLFVRISYSPFTIGCPLHFDLTPMTQNPDHLECHQCGVKLTVHATRPFNIFQLVPE